VDKDTDLLRHVEVTGANVHDVAMASDLFTGEEREVYGNSGYLDTDKREDAITRNKQGKTIRYKVNRKPSQSKNNTVRSKSHICRMEREKSSVRAKVERIFRVAK
jgi:transposase, IS5 family